MGFVNIFYTFSVHSLFKLRDNVGSRTAMARDCHATRSIDQCNDMVVFTPPPFTPPSSSSLRELKKKWVASL